MHNIKTKIKLMAKKIKLVNNIMSCTKKITARRNGRNSHVYYKQYSTSNKLSHLIQVITETITDWKPMQQVLNENI